MPAHSEYLRNSILNLFILYEIHFNNVSEYTVECDI